MSPANINCLTGCCATCTFGTDNFDRSNDTDIDTGSNVGWTEVSGSWDISSNTLVCSSAGIALCDTSHPDSKPTVTVTVDADHDTSGSTVDIIVGYVTSSNYFYARFTFSSIGGGSVQIRRNNGGVHTTISNVVNTATLVSGGATHPLRVCASAATIFAGIDGTGVFVATNSAQTITGTQVALSCSGSGNATFDNFVVAKSYESSGAPNCPRCVPACVYCESSDVVPSAIQAVVNSGPYAGTYICERFEPVQSGVNTCGWYGPDMTLCTPSKTVVPRVTMATNSGTGTGSWSFQFQFAGVTFTKSAPVHVGDGSQVFFDDCTVPPTGMPTTTSHVSGCPTPLGTETCDLSAIT